MIINTGTKEKYKPGSSDVNVFDDEFELHAQVYEV